MDFARPFSVVTPTLDGDVLSVLVGADEEFSGRRIHRLLGRGSEPGVRRAADRLVDQGIVLRRQAGRAKLYRLNRDHLAAPYVSGLALLRAELVDRLQEAVAGWSPSALCVVLFGSVARGEAGPRSDLDVLVVRSAGVDEDEDAWREQSAALERMATNWTGNEARIVEYGEDDLGDPAVRSVVDDALRDGIDLSGSRRRLQSLLRRHAV
jgi:predicted nucleotidyltransferase